MKDRKITRRAALEGGLALLLSSIGSNRSPQDNIFKMPDGRILKVDTPDVLTEIANSAQVSTDVRSKILRQLSAQYPQIRTNEPIAGNYVMFSDVNLYEGSTDVTFRIVDVETQQILKAGSEICDETGLPNMIYTVQSAIEKKADMKRMESGKYFSRIISN